MRTSGRTEQLLERITNSSCVKTLISRLGNTLCYVFLEVNNVAYRTTVKGDNT